MTYDLWIIICQARTYVRTAGGGPSGVNPGSVWGQSRLIPGSVRISPGSIQGHSGIIPESIWGQSGTIPDHFRVIPGSFLSYPLAETGALQPRRRRLQGVSRGWVQEGGVLRGNIVWFDIVWDESGPCWPSAGSNRFRFQSVPVPTSSGPLDLA